MVNETDEFLENFDNLCEMQDFANIDVEELKRGINEIIENHT